MKNSEKLKKRLSEFDAGKVEENLALYGKREREKPCTRPMPKFHGSDGIAKYCACIIAVVLLLTDGSASSVIDDIKADMTLNEAPLLLVSGGAGWHTKAIMSMGSTPRGDNTPSWWTPANPVFKSSATWNALSGWFVIYKGSSHAATNVRVKIYEVEMYVLKKSTNKWELVSMGGSDPSWAAYYSGTITSTGKLGPAAPRVESDGKLSYKLTAESASIHGGMGHHPNNGSDVAAVFGRLKSQLILDDPSGVDDRHLAQLLVSVGGDYYLTTTTGVAEYTPMTFAPSMAGSRFGLVSATPRTHYVATIDPPGQDNIGSVYQLSGGVSAIPVAQFEANPPPLLLDTTAPSAPVSLMIR